MDFNQLFENANLATYEVKFPGYSLFFALRTPTNSEDRDYRRKSSKVALKQGSYEPSDAALDAPLWLFDKLCTSVEIENGAGSRESLPEEWRQKILNNQTKLSVIRKHLERLQGEEAGELGN